MSSNSTTNDNIRDLIDRGRLETKGDISKLSDKLDALATKVDNIDKAQAISSTKISMIVAGISIVVSGIVSTVIAQIRRGL